jgi:hypothetical protein
MVNIAETRIRKGLFRLLNGPMDVDRWDAHIASNDLAGASAAHAELFERYCDELRPAVALASQTWLGELGGWASQGNSAEEAEKEMWTTYPAGPAAQPFFVALVRRYWLACDALNKSTSAERSVRPEQFLLGWLQSAPASDEMVAVLACMPYWPMGIDAEGRWI